MSLREEEELVSGSKKRSTVIKPTKLPVKEWLTSPQRLKMRLWEKGLVVGEEEATVLWVALMSRDPSRPLVLFFTGPPGVGKTKLAETLSSLMGAKKIVYQCTEGTDEDDLRYQYIPDDNTKSGFSIRKGVLPLALEYSKKGPTVLILDEFDKTRDSVDAFLLDYAQNCRITIPALSDEPIEGNPANLTIIITSNEVREISEPLMRRVIWLDIKPLDTHVIGSILREKGIIDKETLNLLMAIYQFSVDYKFEKIATIQELYDLGKALMTMKKKGIELSGQLLVVMMEAFVVKGMDREILRENWESFTEYLSRDFAIELPEEVEIPGLKEFIERFKRHETVTQEAVHVDKRFPLFIELGTLEEIEENFERLEPYSKAILKLRLPVQNSASVGDFKVVFTKGKFYLVAERPLSFKEALDLHEAELFKGRAHGVVVSGILPIEENTLLDVVDAAGLTVVYHDGEKLRAAGSGIDVFFQRLGDNRWGIHLVGTSGESLVSWISLLKALVKLSESSPEEIPVWEEAVRWTLNEEEGSE